MLGRGGLHREETCPWPTAEVLLLALRVFEAFPHRCLPPHRSSLSARHGCLLPASGQTERLYLCSAVFTQLTASAEHSRVRARGVCRSGAEARRGHSFG